MTNQLRNVDFVYFGGEPIGVPVLEELYASDLAPKLIVCNPDRPVGRTQVITPPPVKVWAGAHGVPVWQPESWQSGAARETATQFLAPPQRASSTIFVVVAYNHILPAWLLKLSPHGVINVHPSLLPKLRGPSPIRTAIRDDLREQIGVSIMLLDAEMDSGPVLAQKALPIADEYWPLSGPELDEGLARLGGTMLADTLPRYLEGEITPTPQDHTAATYCKRFTTNDRELIFDPQKPPQGEAAHAALRHIKAFTGIGDAFFYYQGMRIKINSAHIINQTSKNTANDTALLQLETVTPAGQKPQPYASWQARLK